MMKFQATIYICLSALCTMFTQANESESYPVFITEKQISAITLQDQSNAIKLKLLKAKLSKDEVIKILTSYRKVNRMQYFAYSHQIGGVSGSLSFSNGKIYKWSIEPGYAAIVQNDKGKEVFYLLHPELKTEHVLHPELKTEQTTEAIRQLKSK